MRSLLLLVVALATSGCLVTTTAPPLDPGVSSLPAGAIAAREGVAINQLVMIKRAEEMYFAKNGSYGTIDQIVADGGLNQAPQQIGYTVELSVTADGYQVVAVPSVYGPQGRRSFFMDQTGIVRGDDHQGGAASPNDPPVS
jgi:hypothetical protein